MERANKVQRRLYETTGMTRNAYHTCFASPSFISVQPEIEEWSSWDEEAPTSIKIEGGNGNVSPAANEIDEEPDYFKDMAPTIRKTQKVRDDCVIDPHRKSPTNAHIHGNTGNFESIPNGQCWMPHSQ